MPRALTNALPKWLAFAVGLWAAQAALAVEDHLLLGGRAVTMSDPVNTFRFYYEIPNGITVDWQKVDLFWDSSPTIRPESSSITVLLNGQTLASNRLRPAANSGAQAWTVNFPTRFLRKGVNELTIVTRQRSVDGPCQDIENAANWVRLEEGSAIITAFNPDPNPSIASYPYPILDPLGKQFSRFAFDLGATPEPAKVATMLGLASDWGVRWLGQEINTPMVNGKRGNQPHLVKIQMGETAPDGTALPPSAGWVGFDANRNLILHGNGSAGLRRARNVLTDSTALQLAGKAPNILVDKDLGRAPALGQGRVGQVTFGALGYPKIQLLGAFTQRAKLFINRPLRVDIGKQSFLKLKFKHSAAVDPARSLLTVKINGVPVGSVRLTDENANEGTLAVRLPVEELAKFSWEVELEAYHYLGNVDCSKSYDSIAWTVIDGTSEFVLEPGGIEGPPSLVAFPYVRDRDGGMGDDVRVEFSSDAGPGQYEFAAAMAALAGRSNRGGINFSPEAPTDSRVQVWIGRLSEVNRFEGIREAMHLAIGADGKLTPQNGLSAVPQQMEKRLVLQAIRSPMNPNGVIYVALAKDDEDFAKFAALIAKHGFGDKLNGDAAVVDWAGDVVSLRSEAYARMLEQSAKETNSYTVPMRWVMAGLVTAVALLVLWIIMQFVAKKRPAMATR